MDNAVSRTVALIIVALLVLLLILRVAVGEEPKPLKFKRGSTMFVYAGERDGQVVLEPYLSPQLFFVSKPTVEGGVPPPLQRGQALTCDYFTAVKVEEGHRDYTIRLRCHGEFGPVYILDGIAFR